jgi:hypothetical protein
MVTAMLTAMLTACSSGEPAANGSAPTVAGRSAAASTPATGPTTATGSERVGPPTTSDPAGTADPTPPAIDVPPDQRPYPGTAEQLAAALGEAEVALRAPGIDEEEAAPWGRRQQLLYRVLAANPAWAPTVEATVDPAVLPAVSANWLARQEALALVSSSDLSPTLPAWRIEPPLPADELLGYYREAEAATGVPWHVLAAVNLVETRMGRINGVSTAGAVGPMQFLPSTWEQCCEGDPTNDRDAILGAATYLTIRGAPGDLERALYGYNNSDHYVQAVQAYASVMAGDVETYYGYHAWEVLFLSSAGLVRLTVGYEQAEPVDATAFLRDHPDALIAPPGT